MPRKPRPSVTDPQQNGLLQAATAVVLYNKRTGVIFGIHYFGAADGVDLPDADELSAWRCRRPQRTVATRERTMRSTSIHLRCGPV